MPLSLAERKAGGEKQSVSHTQDEGVTVSTSLEMLFTPGLEIQELLGGHQIHLMHVSVEWCGIWNGVWNLFWTPTSKGGKAIRGQSDGKSGM